MNRIAIALISALFALSGLAVAQVDEKAGQQTKNPVFGEGAASFTGSLNGAPTYDRIFTSDVNNGCAATSSFSGSGVGVEYALVPIWSPTGATLVADLSNPGTDIGDSVLSLYCNPFDPANADLNLVAYDDDGGAGLLSAFDGSEGAVLAPNTQYFLVVSLFSPASIGGGNFELTVDGFSGGQVLFGTPVVARPVPALGFGGMTALLLLLGALAFVTVRRMS